MQNAPVELLWEFPIQPKLTHSILLGLQNGDELNFGVGEFWSYFFPFEKKRAEFEELIDHWVTGTARVIPKPGILIQTQMLQIFENGVWNTTYARKSVTWRKPHSIVLTNLSN